MGAAAPDAMHVAPLPAGRRGCDTCSVCVPSARAGVCPLPDLFSAPAPSLCEFMQQDLAFMSAVVAECQRVHAAAASERAVAAGGEAA